MALFQSASKSGSLTGAQGEVAIKQFEAAPVSGRCEAVTISLAGNNGKKYSMTLYGQEVDRLRETIVVKLHPVT